MPRRTLPTHAGGKWVTPSLHHVPSILELGVKLFFFFHVNGNLSLLPVFLLSASHDSVKERKDVLPWYRVSSIIHWRISLNLFPELCFCLPFFCLPRVYIWKKNVNVVYNVYCYILQRKSPLRINRESFSKLYFLYSSLRVLILVYA